MAGTYPDTITYKGKRYRFFTRAYAKNVIEGKAGAKMVYDTAKEERKKGNLARVVKRVGRTHTVYFLYVHRERKSRR